ncbi:sugar ABC transporter permease [Rugosimonospora acidiphila]|uniref:Sugar ABC transporter permease n=2 Tax=Rugosimonospora acidiphila TaxID=556531 RepID=A0ABP9S360_9ACTN
MRENAGGWALAAPSAVLLALFFLLPLGLTIWMSFFNWPAFGPSTAVGVKNYSQILSDPKFGHAVAFTVKYTVITTVLGLVVSLVLALLVRPKFRLRTGIRALLFAPVTIGMAPAGLLWLSMSNSRTGVLPTLAHDLGLAKAGVDWFARPSTTLAIVIVMTIWKTAGLAMLVLIIGMDSIPGEVYEAARLDGASAWSTLTRITMPLIRRPLSLVMLLTVSTTFLGFDQFFTMTKGGPDNSTVTVVYYLYNAAFVSLNRGYAAAVAVIVVVIMAAISIPQVWLQRGKS